MTFACQRFRIIRIVNLTALLLIYASPSAVAGSGNVKTDYPQPRLHHHIDETNLTTLYGHIHPAVNSSQDQGPVAADLMLNNLILSLQPSAAQQSELNQLTQDQQDPNSTQYHQWLTPNEYEKRFGLHPQDITAISNYLSAHGFSVDQVPPGSRSIIFHGTATQIKNAFHTEIHSLLWHGENHVANTSNPQIPVDLANVVNGIINLHDFNLQSHPQPRVKKNPFGNTSLIQNNSLLQPELNNGNSHFITPSDFAAIYNLNPLYSTGINGKGVTIGIIGRTDVQLSDIAQFQSANQPPFTKLNPPQVVLANGDPGFVSGDQLESTLDLEWAGAVAPAATVKFITSPGGIITSGRHSIQGDGILYSAMYAVTNNLADIISLSYSGCEQSMGSMLLTYINSLWQQAAAQGISVMVASGDTGAANCDASNSTTATNGLGVNGLCSSPYSTCVGGSEFNDTTTPSMYWLSNNPAQTPYTTAIGYIPEVVWNESGSVGGSNLWSSGGGASLMWSKPTWQVSPGVPNDGARDVPDVSLTASIHDGYQIWSSDSGTLIQEFIGGTSASTPSFAGIIALAVQYNGGRLGNINPTLYGLSQLQANGGYNYFNRITSGNNSVPGQTGYSANANGGYNQATGLGSVNANILIRHSNDYANISNKGLHASIHQIVNQLINPETAHVGLNSSASSINSGQSATFTATVSGDSPTGNVQFFNNGSLLATVALSGGQAVLNTTLPAGNQLISAQYSGDNNNLSAISVTLTETVLTNATISVSASTNTIVAGQSITLTATVSGFNPTGTVQFYLNGAPLDAPVNVVNGVAVLTTPDITITGNDAISATYSGDSNNSHSTSTPISETVTTVQPTSVPALPKLAEALLAVLLAGLLWQRQKTH